MKIFLLVFVGLILTIGGVCSANYDYKNPDKTILSIPDEIPASIFTQEGELIPIYVGQNFALLALRVKESGMVYSILLSVEKTRGQKIVHMIGIGSKDKNGVFKFFIDKGYFEGKLPDGVFVLVDSPPDFNLLVQIKDARKMEL